MLGVEGAVWKCFAGLGLRAASLTAYRDLTLGVKSTFFGDSTAACAVFGLSWLSNFFTAVAFLLDEGRDDRRIDFSPAKVGNFEAKLPDLVVGANVLVDCGRCGEKGFDSECFGIGGSGRGDFVQSLRGRWRYADVGS